MKKVKIYALVDPITGHIRYIGKTIQRLSERIKIHVLYSRKATRPTYKEAWIKKLLNRNLKPTVKLLEECSEEVWEEREIYWIQFAKDSGWPITNLTTGGDGGHGPRHSDDFKNSLKARMKGNKYSVGVKWSDEQRELRRMTPAWNKGKKGVQKFSDESKRKRSERMRGDKHHGAKLTDMQIIEMRRRFNSGDAPKKIAIDYNINYSHCIKIVTNKTRTSCVPS